MKIDTGLLAEEKALAIERCPELGLRPLYVVNMDTFEGLPITGGCYGHCWNGVVLEHPVIDCLGDSYEGPGPIIALDGKLIAEDCEPQNFNNCVRQVMVHEVAHCFPTRCDYSNPEDAPEIRQLQIAHMAAAYNKPSAPAGSENDCHDWKFIRRCCHILFRAKLAGANNIPTLGLHKGHAFLTSLEFYMFQLLPEMVELKSATMATVEATPAPAGFMEIWNCDKQYNDKWQPARNEN